MAVDRISEIKKKAKERSTESPFVNNINGDVPLENFGNNEEQMKAFYEEVSNIKDAMNNIQKNIGLIEEMYNSNLSSFSADKSENLTRELQELVAQTNKLSNVVNNKLKQMTSENKSITNASNAEIRIRESMQATLAKKFYELMTLYQELKAKNAVKYRDRIKHQVEIASGNKPTEDELDEILEAGDTNRLFATKILADKRHDDAANALIFIKDRHNDILKLEKSINELYQIFLDMATLVETQGEMIDQIEFQVSKSVEYIDKVVINLKISSTAAKRSRMKILIIVILVVIVIAIIGLAIGLAVGLQKHL